MDAHPGNLPGSGFDAHIISLEIRGGDFRGAHLPGNRHGDSPPQTWNRPGNFAGNSHRVREIPMGFPGRSRIQEIRRETPPGNSGTSASFFAHIPPFCTGNSEFQNPRSPEVQTSRNPEARKSRSPEVRAPRPKGCARLPGIPEFQNPSTPEAPKSRSPDSRYPGSREVAKPSRPEAHNFVNVGAVGFGNPAILALRIVPWILVNFQYSPVTGAIPPSLLVILDFSDFWATGYLGYWASGILGILRIWTSGASGIRTSGPPG